MPKSLTLPVSAAQVRELEVGDEVLVSGRIITAREAAHRHLAKHEDPIVRRVSEGSLVYHCGPVVSRDPRTETWRFLAAGPTASIRQEPYQADVLARFGLRGVIGKGGMGPRTLAALRELGAVYLHAEERLAVVLARCVTKVEGVYELEELGAGEAIWTIQVKDFPAIVTMDAHGETLHALPAEAREDAGASL